MSDDLKTKVEAAGKALGDLSDKSNTEVQKHAGWFTANKLLIVGGIAGAVVLAILVHAVS